MEFVVYILTTIFSKSLTDATALMLTIHSKGQAVIGVYTYEIAETKVIKVHSLARENEFPLKATIERD